MEEKLFLHMHAKKKKKIRFFQKIQKFDDINVNSRETKSGDLLLIIAVKNNI